MRLLPRDEKFFDLFTSVAAYGAEAAALQQELLRGRPASAHGHRGSDQAVWSTRRTKSPTRS